MKHFILALKGMVLGIGNIIPGVSGGTLAIILKIYEKLLDSINNIFKKFKESISFLIPVGIGILIALLLGSKVLYLFLDRFPIPTCLFFVGLVAGGVPYIFKKCENKFSILNIFVFLITILLVVGMLFIPKSNKTELQFFDYFLLFIIGFIAAATMIIPGISGSLVLMLLGYYDIILRAVKNILSSSFFESVLILLPFGLGVIVGFICFCKLVSYLLKRFPITSYFAILGFVIASIVGIIYNTCQYDYSLLQIIFGIILVPVGFIISFILTKSENEKKDLE